MREPASRPATPDRGVDGHNADASARGLIRTREEDYVDFAHNNILIIRIHPQRLGGRLPCMQSSKLPGFVVTILAALGAGCGAVEPSTTAADRPATADAPIPGAPSSGSPSASPSSSAIEHANCRGLSARTDGIGFRGPDNQDAPFLAAVRASFDGSLTTSSPSAFTLHVPAALYLRVEAGKQPWITLLGSPAFHVSESFPDATGSTERSATLHLGPDGTATAAAEPSSVAHAVFEAMSGTTEETTTWPGVSEESHLRRSPGDFVICDERFDGGKRTSSSCWIRLGHSWVVTAPVNSCDASAVPPLP